MQLKKNNKIPIRISDYTLKLYLLSISELFISVFPTKRRLCSLEDSVRKYIVLDVGVRGPRY